MTLIKITRDSEIEFEGKIYYRPFYFDSTEQELRFCMRPKKNPMPNLEVGMQISFLHKEEKSKSALDDVSGTIVAVNEERIILSIPQRPYPKISNIYLLRSIDILKLWDWRGVIWEKK